MEPAIIRAAVRRQGTIRHISFSPGNSVQILLRNILLGRTLIELYFASTIRVAPSNYTGVTSVQLLTDFRLKAMDIYTVSNGEIRLLDLARRISFRFHLRMH